MEPNTPPTGRGPLLNPERRDEGYRAMPPTPPAYVAYPPGVYPAATKPSRSIWLIFAAIIIAGALIAGGIFLAVSDRADNTHASQGNGASASTNNTTVATDNDAVSSPTCKAWAVTKQTMLAIPDLPAGWNWATPNLDTYIQNRTVAISRALDMFEPKISAEPQQQAAAANAYVSIRRDEISKLRNHTYTSVDRVASESAVAEMDQACVMTG